jgi:hypothetical protein
LNVNPHHEHEFEAAPGLPEALPTGERLLWQGTPDWKLLALHVFHVRTLAIYFSLMVVLQALYLLGEPQARLLVPLATSVALSLTALGLLTWLAWLTARTALYTLTSKRVVMRIGIVLTLTFNLPLRMVAAASVKPLKNGAGDIALKLAGDDHIAWLNLWPHAKPWALKNPEPCLRLIPDAVRVGERLVQAWREVNPSVPVMLGDIIDEQPSFTVNHHSTQAVSA